MLFSLGTELMIKKINLDGDLLSILLTESFDNFTVLELRSAYIAKVNDAELGIVEARKYVYRHILRLEKKGLLKRKYSEKRDRTFYAKTKDFSSGRFEIRTEVLGTATAHVEGEKNLTLKKELTDKLNEYKAELLTSIGETDEYQCLCTQFPQLKSQLQDRYNKTRDNCSKILGRIKALESLIQNQLTQDLCYETS
jgi:hypothetical protein